jgi:hypothetical protein
MQAGFSSLPAVSLDGPATYVQLGPDWLSISLPNLIVIVVMLVLFVLALLLPFPHGHDEEGDQ